MNTPITLTPLSHKDKVNEYIKWLFKRKEPLVVLKRFTSVTEGTTKMYIVLPVRERVFESTEVRTTRGKETRYSDIFKPTDINIPGFDFKSNDILEFKTVYSGDIYEFYNITNLLSKFIFITRTKGSYNIREKLTIFRDYTRTKEQQIDSLTLIESFTDPAQSVNSINRLLHSKYVTIVNVIFKNANYIDPKKHGNKTV